MNPLPRPTVLEASLWTVAAALFAATALWPDWVVERRAEQTRDAAERALAAVAERQQREAARGEPYAEFGASDAERQAALPGLDLGTAPSLFDIDAWLAADGTLRLRAVTRPAAIQDGRATPLLLRRDLAARQAAGQADAPKREAPPGR